MQEFMAVSSGLPLASLAVEFKQASTTARGALLVVVAAVLEVAAKALIPVSNATMRKRAANIVKRDRRRAIMAPLRIGRLKAGIDRHCLLVGHNGP